MNFYFVDKRGQNGRKLTKAEVKKLLTSKQVAEAIEAKNLDAFEEVSYATNGGYIIYE